MRMKQHTPLCTNRDKCKDRACISRLLDFEWLIKILQEIKMNLSAFRIENLRGSRLQGNLPEGKMAKASSHLKDKFLHLLVLSLSLSWESSAPSSILISNALALIVKWYLLLPLSQIKLSSGNRLSNLKIPWSRPLTTQVARWFKLQSILISLMHWWIQSKLFISPIIIKD